MEQHFAVIGDPIEHSLSPVMHKAGFAAVKLNADYYRFRITEDTLRDAVIGLSKLGFTGWNVTIPHKEKVVKYLDELTPEAERAGAVNTVKNIKGKLFGHNTDGRGFVKAVAEEIRSFRGKKAVILGAGGAAKGIAFALMDEGMELLILNRTVEKAKNLADSIKLHGGNASYGRLSEGKWLQEVNLLVQTTSIGLNGEAYPLSLRTLFEGALVADIIFNPWETPFLKDARKRGCRTVNGLGMLLHQGVLAWEYWLGQKAPVEAMWTALVSEVNRRE